MPDSRKVGAVTYREAGQDYFDKRGLRRHAGVWSLWALGVAAVISGDFFGLPAGNFGDRSADAGRAPLVAAAFDHRHRPVNERPIVVRRSVSVPRASETLVELRRRMPGDREHRAARQPRRFADRQRLLAPIEVRRERRANRDIANERTLDHLHRRGVAHRSAIGGEERRGPHPSARAEPGRRHRALRAATSATPTPFARW